jgi:hypothetical protein
MQMWKQDKYKRWGQDRQSLEPHNVLLILADRMELPVMLLRHDVIKPSALYYN